MKKARFFLAAAAVLVLLAAAALLVPGIRTRIINRFDQLQTRLYFMLKAPEKDVFVPQGETTPQVNPSPSPTPEPATATAVPNQPTATIAPTPTPLPASVAMKNVRYVDQHGLWNYCAPANLTMALYFWGWQGDRTDVGKAVKPYAEDKNVMPYELADFVREKTQLAVVQRSGGSLDTIKALVAAGFPVIIEKGVFIQETTTGKLSWMGHYTFITGYDDAAQQFITQDSYYSADYLVAYKDLERGWRAFNFVFLVVYPPDKDAQVMKLLGPLADEAEGFRLAGQRASDEIYTVADDSDRFFAWYNRGTNLVAQQDFYGAAKAYDEAFRVYALIEDLKRPYRITWYETGPYFAYYYSGRYADVINLATQTIASTDKPYLEESFYWRAMAYSALGDAASAARDLRQALEYHPGFAPVVTAMTNLGITP